MAFEKERLNLFLLFLIKRLVEQEREDKENNVAACF